MKYLSLIRSSYAYKTLSNDVKSGNISHAYLAVSGDRELLDNFFYVSACLIFCGNGGCMNCEICKKILSGNHADVRHLIPPEDKGLKVENIEEMISSTLLSPIENSGRKLYFIYKGEKLSPIVQNKLLKTLEEPPKGVTIFIGTESEASILQTVKSRTRKLYIDNFEAGEIYRELAPLYGADETVREAAYASGGNISRAEKIIYDKDYKESFADVWTMFSEMNGSRDIINYLGKPFLSKERLGDTLNIVEQSMRDVLEYILTGKCRYKRTEMDIIKENYTPGAIVKVIDLVIDAKDKLSSYCNAVNVVDSLLYKILEVRYTCRK